MKIPERAMVHRPPSRAGRQRLDVSFYIDTEYDYEAGVFVSEVKSLGIISQGVNEKEAHEAVVEAVIMTLRFNEDHR